MPSKPATSCHLRYGPIDQDSVTRDWTLSCTVTVKESTDCTYFCVVGWSPGGYSGIQQIDQDRRVAIFSMWNEGKNSVEEVDHGDGVVVTEFGGEGTGLKSMKDFQWKEGEEVTFTIEGKLNETFPRQKCPWPKPAQYTWTVSCWFEADSQRYFMASFRRTSPQLPLSPGGFYSFVEDWYRGSEECQGHGTRRSAEFSRPMIGQCLLKRAMFTKVEDGEDRFACEKATGGTSSCERKFFLATGGDEAVEEELRNTCVKHNTTLTVESD